MAKDERDKAISNLMEELFKEAGSSTDQVSRKQEGLLDTVFKSKARGFREILLVIVVAKLLTPSYSALKDFYACNPRAIYEGPIRAELAARKIPRGKSGPLNVAKATRSINEQWAAQRRPKEVADAIVALVKDIEKMNEEELRAFAVRLHTKFLEERSRVSTLAYSPSSKVQREAIIGLSIALIQAIPDEGNTPQFICGEIIQQKAALYNRDIRILGLGDRACTTSTTSKKPGDIVELNEDGVPIRVFEISVKVVNSQRLDDCVEAIESYINEREIPVHDVFFLCREEDVSELFEEITSIFFGTIERGGIEFHFMNIFSWVELELGSLPDKELLAFFDSLQKYVSDENTSESVKSFWRDWFTERANGK